MTPRRIVLIVVAALVLSTSPLFAWTGSLSTSDGGLTSGGNWQSATLSWDVTALSSSVYQYEYTLDVGARGDVSHMILELTQDDFFGSYAYPSVDLFNLQWYQGGNWVDWTPGNDLDIEVKEHLDTNPGNPSMPDDLFGIKMEDFGDFTSLRWRFDSQRLPVWGDFYAKGGGGPGGQNYLYNSGFAAPDPLDGPADGSIDNHLLRPDGRTPELPPAALTGLSTLPLGIAYLRGRRRRQN